MDYSTLGVAYANPSTHGAYYPHPSALDMNGGHTTTSMQAASSVTHAHTQRATGRKIL